MSHDLIPLALDIFHHPKISLPIKEALNAIWPVLSLLNLSNIIIHYPFSCGSFSHPDSERFYDHLMAMHHHPDLAQHDIVIDSCLSAIEILSQGVLGHTVPTAAAVDIPTAAPLTSLFFDPPIAAVPDLLEEEGMVVPPSLPCYSIDSIESATAALNECRDWALVWQLRNPAGERGSALRYDLRNDALQNALLLIERLLEKLHHPRQPSDEFGALALLELIWRAAKELCVGRLIHLPAYNESGLHVIQSCRYTNSLRQLSDLIALYTEPPPPAPLWVDQCHVPISYPFPYAHHVKRLPELQTLISSMIQPAETERRELMNEVYATAIYPGLHYLLLIARQFGSC